MKIKVNWKMFLVFFVVIGGLYYITQNFWITAGIMVILLLIDGFLREYDLKKRGEKQAEEILKGLEEDDNEEDNDEKEDTK
ncbi:hypothetical protein [Prevotella intermedia]|jgi:hypothetical protein|uniref:Uncharacterized protein n=1 Tax=Prevotella intermedia TaxID=28131 RepID=A0A2G9IEH6_PREIN|nr:hypothetical protein [Prevotella intermedia]ATV31353.1 hypothetical protein CTM46_07855 [Prevotella intermedia]AWX07650.1 hypothetical protein CTM55_08550 [Prevotella intermedia]PIK18593.1 hypothetical protein CTI16_05690 [Prevotella intermedia]PIN28184.1 hypothetical protein CUC04_01430 [Prevotella intermedia]PJI22387.1 hypothetical protein CTM45_03160 [Prevotella intermedia]